MKHFGIILFVLLITWSNIQNSSALTSCEEKNKTVKWKLEYVKRPYVERKDDSLTLNFSSILTGKLRNGYSIYYVPTYRSEKDILSFPTVGFYTRMGAKFKQRRNVFSLKNQDETIYIKHRNDTAKIKYSKSLLIHRNGESGKLIMRIYGQNCCNEELLSIDTFLISEKICSSKEKEGRIATTDKKKVLSNKKVNMSFYYLVGKDELFPYSEENKKMLLHLKKVIEPLLADTNSYRISQIEIKGYASPEATYNYNLSLAERRAGLFERFLLETYPLANYKITVIGCGEDWDGLCRILNERYMSNQSIPKVLDIINKYEIFEGRERILMELDNGVPYNQLRKEIFPSLRRVELVIEYETRISNE